MPLEQGIKSDHLANIMFHNIFNPPYNIKFPTTQLYDIFVVEYYGIVRNTGQRQDHGLLTMDAGSLLSITSADKFRNPLKRQLLMKRKLLSHPFSLLAAFLLLCASQVSAQIVINAPEPADNPNLPGDSKGYTICANAGFNQFFANVSWAGSPNAGNEFILELSDSTGDFSSPVELARSADEAEVQDPGFEFSIPTDTRGQGYRIRVRSTNPVSTSPPSDPYNMYYMDFTSNLHISPNGDGSTPGTLQVCDGDSVTLTVDNIAPALLNTYQYIWYRSGSPIIGERGPSLTTSTNAAFFVLIDYGPECSGAASTESNIIMINTGSSPGIAINPPSKTALCSGETETLTSTITDGTYSYQWYKDGVALSGATSTSYTVDASATGFEGDYQIEVSGAGICTELSSSVTMTNIGAFTVTRDNPANMIILPGQTQTLSVTTDANTPTFQWFRDGSPISGATNSSFDADETGSYYVEVTQTGGACASTTISSASSTLVSPVSFEATIDYADAYTACENTSVVLDISSINAVLADSSTLDVTSQLASQFVYRWRRDGVLLSGEISRNISLTDPSENGSYTLEGALDDNTIFTEALSVQLLSSEILEISTTNTVFCSGSEQITLSTTTDLTGESFEWQRDGNGVNTTNTSLDIAQPGTYRLVLNRDGCPLTSNEITISPLDPDLITLDPSGDVIFPEGTSRTVTASGGTAYRWYDSNNVEISSGASVTFTTEGTYMLMANIDNCEVTREVTVEYLDTFKVPNVITPNADGFNDQWILPNSYANQSDVSVIIYNDKGIELINELGYQNDWPSSSMSFPKQNMVFYYIIRNANETLKQGTITVIR
ncbi:gliding motility-associated C-terminal domain-containing protein [Ulvibacterium sp.]|uniref:T9SS type B sorting domain-containing protein n=1 Tax=Ulvibacterium sp. TaxID=2665914 RepID=UPI00260D4515|nr:gliding motility-associated C-terminal domain-containing protein [Ulvibacterium sp.]